MVKMNDQISKWRNSAVIGCQTSPANSRGPTARWVIIAVRTGRTRMKTPKSTAFAISNALIVEVRPAVIGRDPVGRADRLDGRSGIRPTLAHLHAGRRPRGSRRRK